MLKRYRPFAAFSCYATTHQSTHPNPSARPATKDYRGVHWPRELPHRERQHRTDDQPVGLERTGPDTRFRRVHCRLARRAPCRDPRRSSSGECGTVHNSKARRVGALQHASTRGSGVYRCVRPSLFTSHCSPRFEMKRPNKSSAADAHRLQSRCCPLPSPEQPSRRRPRSIVGAAGGKLREIE
jgi:hypothetical protein